MRTTLELPDDLMRSVKVRAAQTDRTMTEVVAELLRAGLATVEDGPGAARVRLPLVRNSRTAAEEELSPDRVASLLQDAEVTDLTPPAG